MAVGMTAAFWDVLAPAHSSASIALSVVFVLAAGITLFLAERRVAPPRPEAAGQSGALRRESPAVVNMLTNDATLTAAGFRATLVDLGARGWVRLLPPTEDDELGRVRPSTTAHHGDALLPHERLVLQHVMARFTTDRAVPARYLAVDVNGSWWRRFDSLVVRDAREAGLVRPRWRAIDLAPPAVLTAIALLIWLRGRSGGDTTVAVVDSVERRIWAVATLVAVVAVGYRIVRHLTDRQLTLTEDGVAATARWLAVRERLVTGGFGPMAPSAIEPGDRRLGYATAMCLATGAATELPLAREDHYRAWSSVGRRARLVRVRYPSRLGYGLHPAVALGGGVVAWFIGLRARRFFADVARGDSLDSLYERFPDQDWLISDIATGLTILSVAPIVIGLFIALAGAADMFATIERTGVVLRARQPAEVAPLPRPIRKRIERDRYSLFIAVDDGSTDTVTAWRAGERSAIPQGASAIVRATPVLGYVRRATPVGHTLMQ